jgi:hypothetical protein
MVSKITWYVGFVCGQEIEEDSKGEVSKIGREKFRRFEGRSFEDSKGKFRRFEGEGPKGLRKEGWVKDKKGPHSLS